MLRAFVFACGGMEVDFPRGGSGASDKTKIAKGEIKGRAPDKKRSVTKPKKISKWAEEKKKPTKNISNDKFVLTPEVYLCCY